MDKQETKQKLQPKAEPIDNAVPLESRIHLLTIIGEVEGHESLGDRTKSTKYEEILPRLALIEDDEQIEGILILLHTVGGDVEAGLAIAEMIASLSKPTVSLVLGGGHSIVFLLPSLLITVSSSQARPWFFIPCAQMVCSLVLCRPIVTWKKPRTESPVLSPRIPISLSHVWKN